MGVKSRHGSEVEELEMLPVFRGRSGRGKPGGRRTRKRDAHQTRGPTRRPERGLPTRQRVMGRAVVPVAPTVLDPKLFFGTQPRTLGRGRGS